MRASPRLCCPFENSPGATALYFNKKWLVLRDLFLGTALSSKTRKLPDLKLLDKFPQAHIGYRKLDNIAHPLIRQFDGDKRAPREKTSLGNAGKL
jgi:hypothetical protein